MQGHREARSSVTAGSKHCSDQKLVVAKADFSLRYSFYRKKRTTQKAFNTTTLVGSIAAQQQFKSALTVNINRLVSEPDYSSNDTCQQFGKLFESVETAAISTVGQGQKDFAIILAKIRDTAIFNRLYIKLYIKFVANNGKNRDSVHAAISFCPCSRWYNLQMLKLYRYRRNILKAIQNLLLSEH